MQPTPRSSTERVPGSHVPRAYFQTDEAARAHVAALRRAEKMVVGVYVEDPELPGIDPDDESYPND